MALRDGKRAEKCAHSSASLDFNGEGGKNGFTLIRTVTGGKSTENRPIRLAIVRAGSIQRYDRRRLLLLCEKDEAQIKSQSPACCGTHWLVTIFGQNKTKRRAFFAVKNDTAGETHDHTSNGPSNAKQNGKKTDPGKKETENEPQCTLFSTCREWLARVPVQSRKNGWSTWNDIRCWLDGVRKEKSRKMWRDFWCKINSVDIITHTVTEEKTHKKRPFELRGFFSSFFSGIGTQYLVNEAEVRSEIFFRPRF